MCGGFTKVKTRGSNRPRFQCLELAGASTRQHFYPLCFVVIPVTADRIKDRMSQSCCFASQEGVVGW